MTIPPPTRKRIAAIIVLSWLSMVGVDFLVHGGLLATFYVEPGPFLLPPDQAFRLIPLGYLSFLILAVLLVWLMYRLSVAGPKDGFLFGLKLGALVWGALILGLLSITTADPRLLLGWFIGQTIEMGIASAFAGSALQGTRLTRLFAIVILVMAVCVILTVVLQNTGLAPAVRIED